MNRKRAKKVAEAAATAVEDLEKARRELSEALAEKHDLEHRLDRAMTGAAMANRLLAALTERLGGAVAVSAKEQVNAPVIGFAKTDSGGIEVRTRPDVPAVGASRILLPAGFDHAGVRRSEEPGLPRLVAVPECFTTTDDPLPAPRPEECATCQENPRCSRAETTPEGEDTRVVVRDVGYVPDRVKTTRSEPMPEGQRPLCESCGRSTRCRLGPRIAADVIECSGHQPPDVVPAKTVTVKLDVKPDGTLARLPDDPTARVRKKARPPEGPRVFQTFKAGNEFDPGPSPLGRDGTL